MLALGAIGAICLLALVFGPTLWIKWVLDRHGRERPDFPGTGGELARHLLDQADLKDVKVETTDAGDHYDPDARAVRLVPKHHDGRSVAAVAVAAHEVSHALQHARSERPFLARLAFAKNMIWIDRIATAILLLAPVVFAVVHVPALFVLQIGAAILLLGMHVVIHLITLPVEFDASFGKALPALARGGYLSGADLPAARHVLTAAAWTYVAAALATLLNVMRWFRIFR